MRELELNCDCHTLDCRIRLTLDDCHLYVETIVPRRTFLTRLKNAYKYVFGTRHMSVAEVVLPWRHETIVSIREFLG